jgi:hypothetical protein
MRLSLVGLRPQWAFKSGMSYQKRLKLTLRELKRWRAFLLPWFQPAQTGMKQSCFNTHLRLDHRSVSRQNGALSAVFLWGVPYYLKAYKLSLPMNFYDSFDKLL